ncbi:MAG: hypothetical protein R3B49_05985 [Phycisphaerales bacterium]
MTHPMMAIADVGVAEHRGSDDQQEEHRDRHEDLDHAVEQEVHPPAEIAHEAAHRHADDDGDAGRDQPDGDRQAAGVQHLGEHVLPRQSVPRTKTGECWAHSSAVRRPSGLDPPGGVPVAELGATSSSG